MKTRSLLTLTVLLTSPQLTLTRGADPDAYVPPTLRHVNYVAVRADRGAQLKCELSCASHGYRAYQDWLKCRLVRPDGLVAAAIRVRPDEKGTLQAAVAWDGMCAIEANSGWNLAQLTLADDLPHAFRSGPRNPMKTVRAWGPLHFYVPEGTPYFNVWIHASVAGEGLHYVIRDPAGQAVREEDGDFNKRTKIQIRVGQGQAAAAWSIAMSRPVTKGLVLDDVYVELGRHLPPFLAPKPEWAKAFAGDWRHDPKAPRPRRRIEPTAAKLEPFRSAGGPDMDRAYSRDASGGWTTTLPVTYVLDYGSKHLGHAEYVPAVASAPPALLHLGKDVPFNHGWGPVKALGGENQAYGHGDAITRISPEQVRERIRGLREMGEALHKSGVRWITPYICAMTVNGDNERRTGFWEFYDHWEEYLTVGLGPRPEADPFEWLQRQPDGSPRIYYGYKYPDEFYPPFKDNHRYAACWRTEGWRAWLCEVVRFVAKCDFDGVFVDNGTSQKCQCERCLAAFREHLTQRYPAEKARQAFGDVALDQVAFPTKGGGLLNAEMARFWCEMLRAEMAELKAVGSRELGREFIVFPNGGRPAYIQRALRDADFVMFEKSHGEYGTHPGLVFSPVFNGVKLRACNDNIFEYKFVQSLKARVKPIILSRAGYPQTQAWLRLNQDAARLGMAECGAFSGGGGFLLRPRFDIYHDALNEYRRFFETHPDLYVGLDAYARVAVLACPEQGWLGAPAHIAAVRALTTALAEAHVLFEYIPDTRFEPAALERCATVVAADLRVVSDAQLRALSQYVKGGGRLVIAGQFAGSDELLAERDLKAGEWAALANVQTGQTQPCGKGAVTRCADVSEVVAALGAAAPVLSCPDKTLAPYVRVNAFGAVDKAGGRLVLHVVNYHVPLGAEADPLTPARDVRLDVPLPAGARVASARTFAPDEAEPIPLAVQTANGRAQVALPALRIYRVVELTLTR